MKIMGRSFLLAILAVVVAAVMGVVLWNAPHQLPEQFIVLPNGQRYQFVGVSYGTTAVPPSILIHFIRRLPKPLADWARNYYGNRVTHQTEEPWLRSPQLFVWFKYVGTSAPPANAVATGPFAGHYITQTTAELTDKSGVAAGNGARVDFVTNVGWSRISFTILPRRSRNLECLFWVKPGNNPTASLGKIIFRNPLYRPYPQWKPEPIPAVKQADGLEVRLDGVMVGSMRDGMTMYTNANGAVAQKVWPASAAGEQVTTSIAYSVRAGRGTNEAWVWQSSELSDATGNAIPTMPMGSSYSLSGGGIPKPSGFAGWHGSIGYVVSALWPGEDAWRLKLTLKRGAGFEPQEVVSFKNVSLPPRGTTNTVSITNFAGAQPVVLGSISHQNNLSGLGSWIDFEKVSGVRVELPGEPEGIVLDLVEADTDAGPVNPFLPGDGSGGIHNFRFASIPDDATRMDLTFALQKPRVVVFTFKPPLMTNGIEQQTP
jgi:hypothetical protein